MDWLTVFETKCGDVVFIIRHDGHASAFVVALEHLEALHIQLALLLKKRPRLPLSLAVVEP